MKGKKDMLANALAPAGAWVAALKLRVARGPRILAYHRVFDIGNEDDFPFDPELVSASVDDFAWQMRWIREHLNPVPMSLLLETALTGARLPDHAVAVTFDDGHEDNFSNAFPVLREFDIPATIFLSTGYVGAQGTFWFDEVAYRISQTSQKRVTIPVIDMAFPLGPDCASRRAAAGQVLSRLKGVSDGTRRTALEQLARSTGIDRIEDGRSGALSWSQVEQMRSAGIAFGSHTVSHPILSMLDDDSLRFELAQSRTDLSRRGLGDTDVLAYPVGTETAFDDRVIGEAVAAGYRLGVSYQTGIPEWPPSDPFRIPRLHVERYTSRARFQAMLALPELFS